MHLQHSSQDRSRPALFGSAAVLALIASAAVRAGDIDVTKAEIAGGKLVITGTTAAANTKVRPDGRAASPFNTMSDRSGAFAFRLAYVPGDCVVSLQAASGAADEVAVSGCARGATPRGGWNARASYSANDLVTDKGASWVARRNNTGMIPGDAIYRVLIDSAGSLQSPDATGARVKICTLVRLLTDPFVPTAAQPTSCVNTPTGISMPVNEMRNVATNGERVLEGDFGGQTYIISTAVHTEQLLGTSASSTSRWSTP